MTKARVVSIGDWAKQRTLARREKNLVALLAVRDEIESGLEAGFAAKTVWRYLYETGKVPCKYDTFLKFVNRNIRQAPPLKLQIPSSAPTPVPPAVKKEPELRGFHFNPIPRKEDLI